MSTKIYFRIKNLKYIKLSEMCFFILSILVTHFAFAGPTGPSASVTSELAGLKDAVGQWGTSAAGIAILISGGLAVSSLILPWNFLKTSLGRPAWIGLFCAIFAYIILSFFGNSVHAAITQIVQCPLQIIAFPCS